MNNYVKRNEAEWRKADQKCGMWGTRGGCRIKQNGQDRPH